MRVITILQGEVTLNISFPILNKNNLNKFFRQIFICEKFRGSVFALSGFASAVVLFILCCLLVGFDPVDAHADYSAISANGVVLF